MAFLLAVTGIIVAMPSGAHAEATAPLPAPVTCVFAATAALTLTPGCDYGVPVRSGAHLIVPRVCRLAVEGKHYDRHGVDVRDGATGARIGQAALPPVLVAPGRPMPRVGALLGGAYPLLVHHTGIAVIDAKAGRAEAVFEAPAGLVAVARRGEILAVAEVVPAEKGAPAGLEWTVLDFGAGELLGQLQLEGTALTGLGLRGGAGTPLEAVLEREQQGRPIEWVAEIRNSSGTLVPKDGKLMAKSRPAPARAAAEAATAGCPVAPIASSVLLASPVLIVSPDKSRHILAAWLARMPAPLSGRA